MAYKRNFLDTVIYRIDFKNFITDESVCSQIIEDCVKEKFPQKSMERMVQFGNINLQFDDDGKLKGDSKNEVKSGIQRDFSNGSNKISISNQFVVFEIKTYTNFNEYSDVLFKMIKLLINNFQISTERIGIRYINIFNNNSIKVRKNYFTKEVAAAVFTNIQAVDEDLYLVRDLHLKEYKLGTLSFNFQYGTYNPQYPAPLKNNSFVMDFDGYTNKCYNDADDIIDDIKTTHEYINKLFEKMISDHLREMMNK